MDYTTTVKTQQPIAQPIAITIGNFDGIHRGHQRLFRALQMAARETGSLPVLVTFSPHTLQVVRPDMRLDCLTTLEEKLLLAGQFGQMPDSIVIHFTADVASLTAREFLDELCAHFAIKAMVVGHNFSLGHNRMGDIAFLQQYGREHDILVQAVELEEAERTRISSTRIRSLVNEGRIAEANELLGHPMQVSGIVVKGDQRGRLLGFPTANVIPDPYKLLPANGVYAARVHVGNLAESDGSEHVPVSYDEFQGTWDSAVNVGVRPTFDGHRRLVEAHLLDVELDLYGRYIIIDFVERLRNEQRFNGIEALKLQIAHDVTRARSILRKGDQE